MPDTVQLIDPSGKAHDVPFGDAAGLLTSGWHQQTSADTSRLAGEAAREVDYGGLAGGAKAIGYGLARGGTLGLSDIVARAAGVPKERLQGLKTQNEGLSIGSEIVGGLVPAFGAPGSLLAKTPAGAVSNIGKTIVEATEGASALSRAGTIAAGAAIEGGIYGGGQYLSQVAIEDKPLAAEGFLGAMGKGALWAAPVGGALSLGADVLTRAKSLFPKAEVTRQAARAVDQEATSALSTAVRDGDTMLELARQRIAQTEAQAGASQTAERASRAMFGAADPAAMQNQVAQSVDHAKLTEAADRYTQAKARLDDWVRAEADPDLERALLRIRQPELQVGAPRLRAAEFGEIVPDQPLSQQLGVMGTPGPHEPPRVPITTDLPPLPLDKTTAFDAKDLGLAFDAKKRVYHGAPVPRREAAPHEDATGVFNRPDDDLAAALAGTKQHLDSGGGMVPAPQPPAAVSGPKPVERMTLKEVEGFQSELNAKFDTVASGSPEYKALSKQWDEAIARRDHIAKHGEDSFAEREVFAPTRVSDDEFDTWMDEYKGRLSNDEIEDLRSYSSSTYKDYNRLLRHGTIRNGREKILTRIDSALAKAATPRDIVVYRGLSGDESKMFRSLEPGDSFLEKAYTSTSVDPTAFKRGINLHIEVPAGYQAAAIPSLIKKEKELLLRRHTKYIVTDVTDDGTTRTINVRVVPNDEAIPSLESMVSSGTGRLPDAPPIEIIKSPKAGVAAPARPAASEAPEPDLESALRGTASKLDAGASLGRISKESPAAAEYVAKKISKRADDAAYFRTKAAQPSGLEGVIDAQRIASGEAAADDLFAGLTKPKSRDAYVAQNIGRAMREEGSHAPALAKLEREWAEMSGPRAVAKEIVDRSVPIPPGLKVDDDAIQKALRKHNGKNVDVGADLGRAAKAIGDVEEALAGLVDVLGPDAPATAAAHAKAWKAATEAQVEAAGKSAAKSAVDMQTKIKPLLDADKTIVDGDVLKALRKAESADSAAANRAVEQLARKEGKARTAVATPAEATAPATPNKRRGVFGLAADVGTALEVLNAMGVHVPDVSGIPVIGPVLSMYLKARAVLGILGRRGGSIGRSTESVVASKSAAVRDRVNAATAKLLDLGAAGAKKAAPIAGPAGALGYRLFPGDGETKSKDPRVLYDARMDELARARQPGAIENAVADRIRTADPDLQDAIAAQTRKGIEFLASKAPRESVLASMIPGDGKWHPSKASIEKFSRYVAAVHDPAGVLEDLAHGHVSIESAEALRTVYPKLYAEAQRILLEHAAAFRATLPYSRRVSISLMYQVPVDGTMSQQHMQYLATPAPGAQPAGPTAQAPQQPALTAPLELGQQTLTSLERRAGA